MIRPVATTNSGSSVTASAVTVTLGRKMDLLAGYRTNDRVLRIRQLGYLLESARIRPFSDIFISKHTVKCCAVALPISAGCLARI
jgi:hypothetical protein